MIPYWTNGRVILWQGHVLECLAAMEAGSVQCAVTSPPYWSLRAYPGAPVEWPPVSYAPMAGLPPLDIPGCDPDCEHVWGEPIVKVSSGGPAESQTLGGGKTNTQEGAKFEASSQYCQLCGGWRGCLGLEPSVEMFVGHIVLVARALWRVLRDDGTFWLNFGDSYASSGQAGGLGSPTWHGGGKFDPIDYGRAPTPNALKPKDLIGIPWRVAFALQADGWYLRSDIIWAKGISFCPTYSGSCMPESVRDRPTKGHEYVFLLSKNKRYFYDAAAVRESSASNGYGQVELKSFAPGWSGNPNVNGEKGRALPGGWQNGAGRNLRTVWTINPGSYAGAHFATFPPALVEPMIKAGTSQRGCCPNCGSPWVRVTEAERDTRVPYKTEGAGEWANGSGRNDGKGLHKVLREDGRGGDLATLKRTTTGWTPTCSCGTEHPIPQEELDADSTLLDDFEIEPFEPVPCTVLDPFLGSGTTGQVALKLGRKVEGIELSQAYCDEHIIPRLSKGIQMELL